MKLYATTITDNGKAIGKGGNEFVRVDIRDKTRKRIATIIVNEEGGKMIVNCSTWKDDNNIQSIIMPLEEPRKCFYCNDIVTIPKSTLCNYHHFFKFQEPKKTK